MKGATTDVLNQFLSRSRNFRDDEYGAQNNENRVRLFKEIVQEIKAQCGADFPVLTLINAVEEMDSSLGDNDGFIVLEEAQYLAQELERAGADLIQVRVGVPGQEITCYGPDCNHTGYQMDGATDSARSSTTRGISAASWTAAIRASARSSLWQRKSRKPSASPWAARATWTCALRPT